MHIIIALHINISNQAKCGLKYFSGTENERATHKKEGFLHICRTPYVVSKDTLMDTHDCVLECVRGLGGLTDHTCL